TSSSTQTYVLFFCQAEAGIRYFHVTGVQTCALPISPPFDRVIAWATPTVIPKAWTDQTRHGGRIVTPVKIAPVASANLTVAASEIGRASCRERVDISVSAWL